MGVITEMTKDRARQRLRENVYNGSIIKPDVCSMCLKRFDRRFIGGHHHNGYERWWDVVWLCTWCHIKVDIKSYSKPGESHPLSKLTNEQVLEIRSIGKASLEIARRFGTTYENLKHIIARRTWRHI